MFRIKLIYLRSELNIATFWICMEAQIFSFFFKLAHASHLRLNAGLFYLMPEFSGYCLNAIFYIYQAKSKFKPASSYWISTFYGILKAFSKNKQIAQFSHRFLHRRLKGNLHIFSLSSIHIQVIKILQTFLHIWIRWVRGFSKCLLCCNWHNFFAHFFAL